MPNGVEARSTASLTDFDCTVRLDWSLFIPRNMFSLFFGNDIVKNIKPWVIFHNLYKCVSIKGFILSADLSHHSYTIQNITIHSYFEIYVKGSIWRTFDQMALGSLFLGGGGY